MKKFVLSLIIALILVFCGWQGHQGFGTAPVMAQLLPPPGVASCDPYYETCTYYNYYTAPYADPPTQFFYYIVPETGAELRHELREQRREERREERRDRDYDRDH